MHKWTHKTGYRGGYWPFALMVRTYAVARAFRDSKNKREYVWFDNSWNLDIPNL